MFVVFLPFFFFFVLKISGTNLTCAVSNIPGVTLSVLPDEKKDSSPTREGVRILDGAPAGVLPLDFSLGNPGSGNGGTKKKGGGLLVTVCLALGVGAKGEIWACWKTCSDNCWTSSS